jgi:hypothetical protein
LGGRVFSVETITNKKGRETKVMENKKKKLEESIKDKLKRNGVSDSWMKDHLIIDVMDGADISAFLTGKKGTTEEEEKTGHVLPSD